MHQFSIQIYPIKIWAKICMNYVSTYKQERIFTLLFTNLSFLLHTHKNYNHHHHCFLPMRLMFVDQSSRFQPRRSPTLYFPSLRSQTAALPLCSSLQTWCSVAWIILVLTQYRLFNSSILCCVCVICTSGTLCHSKGRALLE